MVGVLLRELKLVEILNEKNVSDLKQYIYGRFSPDRHAAVFADAVSKIVDGNIADIGEKYRPEVKRNLFRNAVKRPSFAIDAADIFKACLTTKADDDVFFGDLSNWISSRIKRYIASDSVKNITLKVRKLLEEYPLEDIDGVIHVLEAVEEKLETGAAGNRGNNVYAPDGKEVPAAMANAAFDYVASPDGQPDICSIMEPTGIRLLRWDSENRIGFCGRIKCMLLYAKQKKRVLEDAVTVVAASAAVLLVAFQGWSYKDAAEATSISYQAPVYTYPQAVYETAAAPVENEQSIYGSVVELFNSAKNRYADRGGLSANNGYRNPLPEKLKDSPKKLNMSATAYDLSVESCGKTRDHPEYGIGFAGRKVKAGRTVAVDPSIIPIDSKVYISFPEKYKWLDGEYVAEDTGRLVKGNKVDIFFGEDKPGENAVHKYAKEFGIQKVEVYILNEK